MAVEAAGRRQAGAPVSKDIIFAQGYICTLDQSCGVATPVPAVTIF